MRAISLLSVVSTLLVLEFASSASSLKTPRRSSSSSSDDAPASSQSIGVNILHVNPLKLSHYLKNYDAAIVFYYVEYCQVCNKLQEVYARASYLLGKQQRNLSGGVAKRLIFAAVNCGTHYQGCKTTGVRRVPVFKRVRNGGTEVEVLNLRYVNPRILLDAIGAD